MTAALLWWKDAVSSGDTIGERVNRGLPVLTAVGGSRQLNLDAIDAVDAVYEEDKDEDKCYLQPVL
jgi:hypothetical protein